MQDQAGRDWLHVSLDDFISMIPAKRESAPRWFRVENVGESDAPPEVAFTNGPCGAALMQAMRDFVAAAANHGLDIIVDDVCTEEEVADYRRQLKRHELTIVRVDVPLETAERRERARGDRMVGLARQQHARIHADIKYDFQIDNEDGGLQMCAAAILAKFDRLD